AEDGAVDGAVEDEQEHVPVVVGEQRIDVRQDAVEQLADRLAAEERRLERHDAAERGGHHLLHLDGVEAADVAAFDLAQRVAALRLELGRDDARGFRRAREAARDDAVEADAAERRRGGLGLAATELGEPDLLRVDPLEVAHLRMAHQVDAPPPRRGHCVARSERPPAACMPATIPGGATPSGKRSSSASRSASASQPSGASNSSPELQPRSALTAPPQTWKTWPVIFCASSAQSATTTEETFSGSSGSQPWPRAPRSNVSSVMRVRAFGARQLTVTP